MADRYRRAIARLKSTPSAIDISSQALSRSASTRSNVRLCRLRPSSSIVKTSSSTFAACRTGPDGRAERAERQQLLDEPLPALRGRLPRDRVAADDGADDGVPGDRLDVCDEPVGHDRAQRQAGDLGAVHADGLLLHDVRGLVRHELEVGRRLALAQEDVGAHGERARLQRRRGGARVGTLVHADGAEVGTEDGRDAGLDGRVQRHARARARDERRHALRDLDLTALGDLLGVLDDRPGLRRRRRRRRRGVRVAGCAPPRGRAGAPSVRGRPDGAEAGLPVRPTVPRPCGGARRRRRPARPRAPPGRPGA